MINFTGLSQVDRWMPISLSPPLFFPFLFSFRFISMDLSGRSTRCQITRALRPTFLIRRHLTPFLSIVITARYLRSVSFLPFFQFSRISRVYYFIQRFVLFLFCLRNFAREGTRLLPMRHSDATTTIRQKGYCILGGAYYS